ncbi:MAG TPA: NPCBM/NEW2 domain-containing protein, partial [Gemmata sp.]|nr:NPCBM/NEW2 domain-containing protein [Gemmata sp.]
KTVAGVVVKYQSIEAISKFDYAQGNVSYLSDLDPQVNAPELPPDEKGLRLNITQPFFRDHGVSGEPIRFGNEPPFSKGLVISADTVLTYTIGGDYRDFKAVVGILDSTQDANLEARLSITADGRQVFSEQLRRKDKPKPISIDVKGVRQLQVIVESGLPVNGNRVVLADARVQK